MSRSRLVLAGVLAALALISTFAPTPMAPAVEAGQSGGRCEALQFAYDQCIANNPNEENCGHIREVFLDLCGHSSASSDVDGSDGR